VHKRWRKNPIPRASYFWEREGPSFNPVCDESDECKVNEGSKPGVCKCSGYSNGGPLLPNLEIVDVLHIPATLKPGRYVMQVSNIS
jgi:hypothetical protein